MRWLGINTFDEGVRRTMTEGSRNAAVTLGALTRETRRVRQV